MDFLLICCDLVICSEKLNQLISFILFFEFVSICLDVGADVLDLAETMVASDGLKYEPVSMNTVETVGVNSALCQWLQHVLWLFCRFCLIFLLSREYGIGK